MVVLGGQAVSYEQGAYAGGVGGGGGTCRVRASYLFRV